MRIVTIGSILTVIFQMGITVSIGFIEVITIIFRWGTIISSIWLLLRNRIGLLALRMLESAVLAVFTFLVSARETFQVVWILTAISILALIIYKILAIFICFVVLPVIGVTIIIIHIIIALEILLLLNITSPWLLILNIRMSKFTVHPVFAISVGTLKILQIVRINTSLSEPTTVSYIIVTIFPRIRIVIIIVIIVILIYHHSWLHLVLKASSVHFFFTFFFFFFFK
jgi:hypothetical protein